MDYGTMLATFYAAPPEQSPAVAVVEGATSARKLRDVAEPIAAHAFWARKVYDRQSPLGLDFLTGYVMGRAAPLGDVPAGVVAATFGVFEPGLVASLYAQAREITDLETVRSVRREAVVESLGHILGDADVASTVAVLRRGLDAAGTVARPLFNALASEEWPDEPLGQLWRACDLYREHRGDGHLAAAIGEGLDGVTMNILTELYVGLPLGSYTASRGWDEAGIATATAALEGAGLLERGELTDEGWRVRQEIEVRTDRAQQPIIDAIGADLDAVCLQLAEWSEAVIAAGGFPPDPRKRAAG